MFTLTVKLLQAGMVAMTTALCKMRQRECFLFNKNSSLKFWELHVPNEMVSSRYTDQNPSHCTSGYCSCKQDAKEQYWEQQFCQIERDISVWPTEMSGLVKVDHLQRWSQIVRSYWTKFDFYWNFPNFGGWIEAPSISHSWYWSQPTMGSIRMQGTILHLHHL